MRRTSKLIIFCSIAVLVLLHELMKEQQNMDTLDEPFRNERLEEQIIVILKEHQAGMSAADLCRRHGISDATFYKWRSKYGGMEVSDAKRLKALDEENRKLKKLLAEQLLDNATLKEMLGKYF